MARVPPDDAALHLVVDFCNTHDLLAEPPDRLTVARARAIADRHGRAELTARLREADLPALKAVRSRLYAVFAADTAADKAAELNALLERQGAAARLVDVGGEDFRMAATGGRDPVSRLAVVLADALARALAEGGAQRLRTCIGDPCRCVYVDRTRAGRQRYCCELCNDRMASAAYRRRKV